MLLKLSSLMALSEWLPDWTCCFCFSKCLSHTTCPFSPHEGQYTVTFISGQYVPSICPEPTAPKPKEQLFSAGTLMM